jgi:peptidoglycan hydrolase-like protein with peptidoglycan-binding domain
MAHQALAVVQEGDRGSQVTVLQQRLQQLGYFKSTVTGYFGSLTKEAVIQFQQAKGLLADGVVGKNTETLLGEPVKSNVQPVKQPVKEPSNGVWRLGDRGQQISAIQESLAVAGFSGGSSGIFDQATQEAVRRFQQAKGLTADGIVGPQTMAALPAIGGSAPLPASGRLTSRLDTNWTDIRTTSRINVRAIQSRLQSQGFYSGPIDGLWGPKTQAAVEAAQRAYRVSADDLKNGGF